MQVLVTILMGDEPLSCLIDVPSQVLLDELPKILERRLRDFAQVHYPEPELSRRQCFQYFVEWLRSQGWTIQVPETEIKIRLGG